MLWFHMPGINLDDTRVVVHDATSMIIVAEEYIPYEDDDLTFKDNGRVRMYGGFVRLPKNQFDLVATRFRVEMKNGVYKMVIPKHNPTPTQQSTDFMLPEGKTQKLEKESTSCSLPDVKQLLEDEESTDDVFYVNVE